MATFAACLICACYGLNADYAKAAQFNVISDNALKTCLCDASSMTFVGHLRHVCWACSYKKLPFEAHPACWNAIPEADARSLIQSLLKPKSQERATATSLLASPLLAGMELLSTG